MYQKTVKNEENWSKIDQKRRKLTKITENAIWLPFDLNYDTKSLETVIN